MAIGRVVGNAAQTIMIMTMIGTLNIMPIIPHMLPQKAIVISMMRGLNLSDLPYIQGSRTLPIKK